MLQKVRGRFVEGVRVMSEQPLDFLVAECLPLDPMSKSPLHDVPKMCEMLTSF